MDKQDWWKVIAAVVIFFAGIGVGSSFDHAGRKTHWEHRWEAPMPPAGCNCGGYANANCGCGAAACNCGKQNPHDMPAPCSCGNQPNQGCRAGMNGPQPMMPNPEMMRNHMGPQGNMGPQMMPGARNEFQPNKDGKPHHMRGMSPRGNMKPDMPRPNMPMPQPAPAN